jgi:hypothetical protein
MLHLQIYQPQTGRESTFKFAWLGLCHALSNGWR